MFQDAERAAGVVLVSGPSGAGRSSAIDVLEDLGFEAIDNLPLSLIPRLLEGPPLPRPLALGVDVRNRDFSSEALVELVDELHRNPEVQCELLYLDCDTDTLLRRFSETRRRHPLSLEDPPLVGLQRELELLSPVRDRADVLIDTAALTPHQLRAEIGRWFAPPSGQTMAVQVQSFSYKRGLPRGVDMVFDCRFLANPHWQPELRGRDGRDPAVVAHVEGDPRFAPFFGRISDLLASLLEAYVEEGKSSLTVAFGCTGGKHRSVAMAEKAARTLAEGGWRVSKRHRELERQSPHPPTAEAGTGS
jgi:RNase adapter protein RapZ